MKHYVHFDESLWWEAKSTSLVESDSTAYLFWSFEKTLLWWRVDAGKSAAAVVGLRRRRSIIRLFFVFSVKESLKPMEVDFHESLSNKF